MIPRAHHVALVLYGACVLSADGARAAPARYERWVQPRAYSQPERRVLRAARQWSNEQRRRLFNDARLASAARSLLRKLGSRPVDALSRAEVLTACQRLGWTDGELAWLAADIPRQAELEGEVRGQMQERLRGVEVDRVGVAVTERVDGAHRLLVLVSRRLLHLHPTASRLRPSGSLRIAGRLADALPEGARLWLVTATRRGRFSREQVPVVARRFDHTWQADVETGVADVQLLVEDGSGPHIAAQFPVGVGASPWGSGAPDAGVAVADHGAAPDEQLAALVLGARNAHGLPLVARSEQLMEVAGAHAADMAQHGYFAHVSPTLGALEQRLRKHGVGFVRALENIGRARDVEDIFEDWMRSPSHRANILDADVDFVGVGLATSRDQDMILATLVLAKISESLSTADFSRSVYAQLNVTRQRLGLPPLAEDEALSTLALRHSREMAGARKLSEMSPIRGDVIGTVFEELGPHEAAADVYLLSDARSIEASPNLRDAFMLAGVGAYPDATGKVWVTILYAAP